MLSIYTIKTSQEQKESRGAGAILNSKGECDKCLIPTKISCEEEEQKEERRRLEKGPQEHEKIFEAEVYEESKKEDQSKKMERV